MTKWTVEDFKRYVGNSPRNDDLDRCNCKYAGTLGHHGCGVCEHSLPVFMCNECFGKAQNEINRI